MPTSQKAIQLIRQISDQLAVRLTSMTRYTEGVAADGAAYVYFSASTPAAGSDQLCVRCRPIADWTLAKDALGNTATMYVPHVVELVSESDGTDAWGYNTDADLAHTMNTVAKTGARIDWYYMGAGTCPNSNGGLVNTTTASLAVSVNDLYWDGKATS